MGRKCFALISVRSCIPTASVCTSLVVPAVAFAVVSVLAYAVSDVVFPVTAIGFVIVAIGFVMVHYHPAVSAEFVQLTVGVELPRLVCSSEGLAIVVAEIVAGAVVTDDYGRRTVVVWSITGTLPEVRGA
jgi:hypothetical protein